MNLGTCAAIQINGCIDIAWSLEVLGITKGFESRRTMLNARSNSPRSRKAKRAQRGYSSHVRGNST